MTDLLTEALEAAYQTEGVGWQGAMDDTVVDWSAFIAALRERGVHLVTVESLARAAQDHETSGIHGPLHCSLACGASLFAALEEASE